MATLIKIVKIAKQDRILNNNSSNISKHLNQTKLIILTIKIKQEFILQELTNNYKIHLTIKFNTTKATA